VGASRRGDIGYAARLESNTTIETQLSTQLQELLAGLTLISKLIGPEEKLSRVLNPENIYGTLISCLVSQKSRKKNV
jgi:hypothetical protein